MRRVGETANGRMGECEWRNGDSGRTTANQQSVHCVPYVHYVHCVHSPPIALSTRPFAVSLIRPFAVSSNRSMSQIRESKSYFEIIS